jgi:hypothetical protein
MAYIGLEEGRQKCVKFSLEISSIIMELNSDVSKNVISIMSYNYP